MLFDSIENNKSYDIKTIIKNNLYTIKKFNTKSLIKTNVKEADINVACLYEPYETLSQKSVIVVYGMGERNIGHLKR
jgi:hypothetical protein